MSELPTRKDLFAVGRQAIVTTPNVRINPAIVDVPGSDVNLLVGAMSLIGEEITSQLAKNLQGLFIETAREDALDRLAADRYGLARFTATPAVVTLTFSRPGAGAGAGTIPAGTRVQTTGGVQFATDNDIVFGGADLSQTGTATAVLSGPDSNVSLGTLVAIADPIWDSTMLVNNAEGAAGGAEAESDIQFRGRLRNFFVTARRATLQAIEYGALQVPQVVVATAYEIINASTSLPEAQVNVVIADRDGASNAAMIQAVENILVEYRAAGIPVVVTGGSVTTPHPTIEWSVSYQAGIDTTQAADQLRAVTIAAAQFLGPGETLYRSDLIAAAKTVPGIIFSSGSLVEPAGDVTPDSDKIIRLEDIDISFV